MTNDKKIFLVKASCVDANYICHWKKDCVELDKEELELLKTDVINAIGDLKNTLKDEYIEEATKSRKALLKKLEMIK
jgi:hypothetical protein